MDCPGCGKKIRDGAKFCPSCGYSVKDTKKETEVRAKKTGDGKVKTTATPVPRVKIEDSKPDIAKQEIEYRGYIEEKKTDSEMVIEEPPR